MFTLVVFLTGFLLHLKNLSFPNVSSLLSEFLCCRWEIPGVRSVPGCNHSSAVTQTPGTGSLQTNLAGFQQLRGDPPPSSFKYSFTELKPVIIRVKYDAMHMERSYLENVLAVSACSYLTAGISGNPAIRQDHQHMLFDLSRTQSFQCFSVFLHQNHLDQLQGEKRGPIPICEAWICRKNSPYKR